MAIDLKSNLITILFFVFSTGLISGLSPCTLPTVAFVTAYVNGKQNHSKKSGFIISLAFTLGIAFMLSILGIFAGAVGAILKDIKVINYVIGIILLVMGFWLLKIFEFDFNNKTFNIIPKRDSGIIGAFLLGIPFGISASPCTFPITASMIAYSAEKGSMIYGMLLMFTYAIGRCIPLMVVGTFTDLLKNTHILSKYQERIEKISGVILILIALYFIWKA
ncbi:cytochrome c biogenesis CcdA family protein [Oceanirhabdus sp. W0125-5]|uniref:cytochrome c biogenesis CcdA family protein n=1 Tax=Oceanirhabdus sp. W0125-5 TaxID=2999116 RepID=UPI0022F2AD62|nr:cytochrome c biogenesis CcdA family protein [Oceanirhabdus sp. W0125-5]WBW98126.1 cytochrome c biogenesis CcdA family protein [Oceanirhabdus sp. W0125-5]